MKECCRQYHISLSKKNEDGKDYFTASLRGEEEELNLNSESIKGLAKLVFEKTKSNCIDPISFELMMFLLPKPRLYLYRDFAVEYSRLE